MMLLLIVFGGAISSGGLLNALTWSSVGYAALALFLVRPLAGWLCLAGTACPPTERAGHQLLRHPRIGIYLLSGIRTPKREP